MLKVNANRKMVRHELAEKTGKSLIMKDIHNIKTAAKPKSSEGVTELQQVADYLQYESGFSADISVNKEDNSLTGIFLQDTFMKQVFNQFPELLLADATHRTNELRMPFYLMTVVDGNGETEVVAAFIVISEEAHIIREMIQVSYKSLLH